ncbi:AAA domain-containing protein [Sanguibacter gelidistatuariae]|uniref:AAA domain-containing protein n=1 Tax=Sanguibacter gelidistatuariae TaxID=1814289 RepID=A0A1G6HI91_9MICO|nr:AAA family ATPase [Sanguibacter gelidistatuariae]SDB93979.1 AAA domain-containing protein [Sanguibacter gelidistatuariae]
MRLISARIRGYGRIVDSKINLDAKVIAIVGPNEAGKTTLLKALTHIHSDEAVPIPQRSRATEVTDQTRVTTFDYVLEESDQDALADLHLQEPPTRAEISRSADGENLYVGLSPLPAKSVKPLQSAVEHLNSSLADQLIDHWIDPNTTYADPEGDAARDYRRELQATIEAIDTAIVELGTELPDEAVETARSLHAATLKEDAGAEQLRATLRGVIDWAEQGDPGGAARTRLWNRTPDFILFNEADRSIQSTYVFDEALVNNPPGALKNLAGTASLDLPQLLLFVQTGDIARRRSAIVQANSRMDAIFGDAWKQSKLSVHIELDGNQLRIELMEDGDNVTVFDERSAGLRMFVALIAFLKVHGSDRLPILLIDEAENHLHIDAQADLVNMFVMQEHAVKVIYTTHSPACLPPDLGTGIRVVVPREDNLQISDVRNSFWQGSAGFSPLMLAMGAAAAAFTPARLVVLAEGATEMILLPTLMRSAIGENELRYQVAPGLSEVPRDFMPKLDLEAARVAYLVDGDDGGLKLKKSLTVAGVPENLVAELGAPGIENLIDPSDYRGAIAALLPECNPGVAASVLPELPTIELAADRSVSKWMEDWFKSEGIKGPSKVAVANWLVENKRATLSEGGVELLKALNKQLLVALGVESTTTSTEANTMTNSETRRPPH